MATAKTRLTANWETKYLESRSPASLSARVVERISDGPAIRIKRSRSDSCSSNTKMRTSSTIPVAWSGTQTELRSFRTSCSGVASCDCSTTTAGGRVGTGRSSSPAEPRIGSAASWISSRRLASPVSRRNRPTVTSSSVLSLRCTVASYWGRLSARCRVCIPSTTATAMHDTVSVRTAMSTEGMWPTPIRRSALTTGATRRLSIMASARGTSTSRPTYSSESTTPAVTMGLPGGRSHCGAEASEGCIELARIYHPPPSAR